GGCRCPTCQTVYFPPRSVCPVCVKHRQSIGRMEPFQLSGEGEVVSYTIVHDAAEGFEMQVPYVMAIVRAKEGPQLTAAVVDIEPGEVRIGLKVRATFRKLREEGKAGVIHYGYKFAPMDDTHRPPDRPIRSQRVPSEAPSKAASEARA
ncbi:MAG: Zn-ribbon domain-containing OB-fold protein, partial [Thermoplasmata archaeon]|nr:Zn-ribbon domain-containing OB-fold protein [Thermoplasmata archaeon]